MLCIFSSSSGTSHNLLSFRVGKVEPVGKVDWWKGLLPNICDKTNCVRITLLRNSGTQGTREARGYMYKRRFEGFGVTSQTFRGVKVYRQSLGYRQPKLRTGLQHETRGSEKT